MTTKITPTRLRSIGELGALLRSRRKLAGFSTLVAGAEAFSVGKRFLSEVERGKESAEIGKVLRVLHGLGLDLAVIDRTVETRVAETNGQNLRSQALGMDFPYDWSNPSIGEHAFIDAVLRKARFMDVLRLVHHFGLEPVESHARAHLATHPSQPRLTQILDRIRTALARHTA